MEFEMQPILIHSSLIEVNKYNANTIISILSLQRFKWEGQ
jgi:hypothetical protein